MHCPHRRYIGVHLRPSRLGGQPSFQWGGRGCGGRRDGPGLGVWMAAVVALTDYAVGERVLLILFPARKINITKLLILLIREEEIFYGRVSSVGIQE